MLDKMPSWRETIGIIGGAGVAAAIELVSRIERQLTTRGACRDSEHPEILLYQATQIPSRSMYLEGRGESFVPGYIEAASRLKNAGASFVAMCCNTAHHARATIEKKSEIPIINLIEESLLQAIKLSPETRGIGLLCSDGTRLSKLYERENFSLQSNATIIYPDEEFQRKVTQGICNIKRGFHRTKSINDPERPANLYASSIYNLVKKDVNVIIMGCTEIPLDFPNVNISQSCVDTIQVLTDTCIDIASGKKQLRGIEYESHQQI